MSYIYSHDNTGIFEYNQINAQNCNGNLWVQLNVVIFKRLTSNEYKQQQEINRYTIKVLRAKWSPMKMFALTIDNEWWIKNKTKTMHTFNISNKCSWSCEFFKHKI